ncbi:hypothetical protein [Trichormus variabilis]|uniref:DUF4393 domain-containing protein n=1 Tax=Trichormus variabilis SAG 1403-4b TaxID=447716 RepID=A0A433UQD7_ANAVA|nr:hypothetical protein [Trichormus variabilis]MBD2626424.1 hypothetical protein [Trichormus variabilis FACHB-164]RUS96037.1 hypothetical protein DSM107003_26990 [Trichormus variabilis SAG 1403-4b]
MSSKESNKENALEYWISTGSEFVGATVGGVMGTLIAGPALGALAGASGVIVSKGLNKLLSDFASRNLSGKEKTRVGAAVYFSLEKIQSYLNAGYKVRNDGFFEEKDHKRSDAEELLEGILLKTRDEHEEKKIKILANILTGLVFSEVSATEGNYLLKLTEKLTYRQICILGFLQQEKKVKIDNYIYYGYFDRNIIKNNPGYEAAALITQIYEMNNLCLVDWTKIDRNNPENAKYLLLDELGRRYCDLADLKDITQEDIVYVKNEITKFRGAPINIKF